MKEVDIKSIDMSNLKKVNAKIHGEGNLYKDKTTVYKIYKDNSRKESFIRNSKLEALGNVKGLKKVEIPTSKIVSYSHGKKLIVGCTTKYIKDSVTLFEKAQSLLKSEDIESYHKLLRKVALTLMYIHKRPENIVVGDYSFFNILVDKKLDHHVIDFDGVAIKGCRNVRIPYCMSTYMAYRNTKLKIDKNFDRLTMLIFYLDSIFNRSIMDISLYEYDSAIEKIAYLKELRSLFRELKRTDRALPHVPYLNEVINTKKLKI